MAMDAPTRTMAQPPRLPALLLALGQATASAAEPCAFPQSLKGAECMGLKAHPAAAASEAACKVACCAQSNCTIWQFCGDFTTYCGSEHGGCYIGAKVSSCTRSKHCSGLDCWQGGCRGSKCPSLPPAPPPPPPSPPACGSGTALPCAIELGALGLQFDGIGGITSNGECRLLYDYPEPQRSELLDYLFLPKFGLSAQILKVEIGSDAQSTVGTEPSFQHTEGDVSYDRGIQFWFMSEAQKRNPSIVIAALEWSAPSWVGSAEPEYDCPKSWAGCQFFTNKNIEYILGWMHGATTVWNITNIDYMGVWNEPPVSYIPPLWLIALREQLNAHGYNSTQLIAPDASSTGSQVLRLLDDMKNSTALANAVDVIGTHGYWDAPPRSYTEVIGRYPKNKKRAWVSESWHQMGTWNGAKGMVRKVLAAQHQGYSGWTAWGERYYSISLYFAIQYRYAIHHFVLFGLNLVYCDAGLLFAAYPVTLCQDKGLLYSTQPWAGSYNIMGSIWTTAHFTQFSEPGWSWLEEGKGTGSFGNATPTAGATAVQRYATLVNPKTGDWSMIVNNLDGTTDQRIAFAVRGGKTGKALSMFATNETSWFIELPAPLVKRDASGSGSLVLDVAAGTVYTITTLTGNAAARKGLHDHSELPAPFPLPHYDNFTGYTDGRSPRYFTDWDGSFSMEDGVLRQLVLHPPVRWHCTDIDPITLIGPGYANYKVETTAMIQGEATAHHAHVSTLKFPQLRGGGGVAT